MTRQNPLLFHHLENREYVSLTQFFFLPSVLLNSFFFSLSLSKIVANCFPDSRRNACRNERCWRIITEYISRSDPLWFGMLSDATNDDRVLETTKRSVIHYTNRRTLLYPKKRLHNWQTVLRPAWTLQTPRQNCVWLCTIHTREHSHSEAQTNLKQQDIFSYFIGENTNNFCVCRPQLARIHPNFNQVLDFGLT